MIGLLSWRSQAPQIPLSLRFFGGCGGFARCLSTNFPWGALPPRAMPSKSPPLGAGRSPEIQSGPVRSLWPPKLPQGPTLDFRVRAGGLKAKVEVAGSCRRLQEVAGGCRRLQEVAGGCRRLQEVAGAVMAGCRPTSRAMSERV